MKNIRRIAIVGCLHGDEVIGKKVIEKLKRLRFEKEVLFIIANKKALHKKVRYIETDLNRSFPGKIKGTYEEKLALKISEQIKKADLVIDIHATNSNFDSLAIVTRLRGTEKKLLKNIPIKKSMLATKDVFGGRELINNCKLGVALDYGPNKKGSNYKKALTDTKQILINVGALVGEKQQNDQKDIFEVFDIYKVSDKFTPEKSLRDFKQIKKGDVIGKNKEKDLVYSSKDFYPLFLGKGRYEETLCLMANKKSVTL